MELFAAKVNTRLGAGEATWGAQHASEIQTGVLLGVLLLSFILAMRGEPACLWPSIILGFFLLLPFLSWYIGPGEGGQEWRYNSFWLMIAGLSVFGCQVVLMIPRVRAALGLRNEELPPRWKYGKKWAGPAPQSEGVQDCPPDDEPDAVRPPA